MVPGDLDVEQSLQVDGFGYGKGFVHVCRVVD